MLLGNREIYQLALRVRVGLVSRKFIGIAMPREERRGGPAVNHHAYFLRLFPASSATVFRDAHGFCESERLGRVQ